MTDVLAARQPADAGATPWLSSPPDHWHLERGKWLFKKLDRPVHDNDEVVTCFRDGVVTLRKNRRTRGFTESLEGAGYQGVRRGDLVIHSMDAFAGAVGVSDSDGRATGVYAVCETTAEAEPHYYKYVIREMARSGWILALAKGIRERSTDFRFATLAEQFLPVPPVEEQRAIVRFLDYADQRIRRAIRAKQKLIALLNEQSQATTYRVLACGLDPNAPTKQLESLPDHEVKEGWAVARLSQVAHLHSAKNRPDLPLLSVFLGRGVIPYGRGSGQVHKPGLDLSVYQVVREGDLVLNNQQAWRGSVGVSKYLGIISPAYVVLSLSDALDPDYANYLFQSRLLVSQFVTSSKGVGDIQRDVHLPWLKNARLPVPPVDEQRAIAAELCDDLREIEIQLARGQREIALLEEYRTRLVADVVTGTVDVRKAAAHLPDDVGELEPEPELEIDPTAESFEELETVET